MGSSVSITFKKDTLVRKIHVATFLIGRFPNKFISIVRPRNMHLSELARMIQDNHEYKEDLTLDQYKFILDRINEAPQIDQAMLETFCKNYKFGFGDTRAISCNYEHLMEPFNDLIKYVEEKIKVAKNPPIATGGADTDDMVKLLPIIIVALVVLLIIWYIVKIMGVVVNSNYCGYSMPYTRNIHKL